MKKLIVLGVSASMLFMTGCVEKSEKYKKLLAQKDSLNQVVVAQTNEMDRLFADINDLSAGMQSLREAEQILLLEAEKEGKATPRSKQQLAQLKADIQSIKEAISGYKAQIAELEKKNKGQSAHFKRMIANLNAELELRNEKIEEITKQLASTNQMLAERTKEVESLNQNVNALNKTSKEQKLTIAEQDQMIHRGYYLVGTRKALRESSVISRQGIFCPPIVSSQAQKADFMSLDIRETQVIQLNDTKAKLLSVHPAESYTLEKGEDGNLVLKINNVNEFWKQTKYLVVMIG